VADAARRTSVVPVAPPGLAVSPQDRLPGKVGVYGRVWCTIEGLIKSSSVPHSVRRLTIEATFPL
jgi:hypothetical protein